MIEMLPFAIGIGLVVSLLLSEIFGFVGAGLVVPGYVALNLTQPVTLAVTLLAGLATYLLVRVLSSFVIIFGRRRTVLMILAGYLLGMIGQYFVPPKGPDAAEFAVIGFIIPGLIAVALDRWGPIESLCALFTVSVIVRLILVFIYGPGLLQ
jgi:poly-gamma-glutamate biosynthesis protein PgsC/CapC